MAAPVYEGMSEFVEPSEVDAISLAVYQMSEQEVLDCIDFWADPDTPGYYLLPDGKGVESVSYEVLVEHARKQKIGELYTRLHADRATKMANYVVERMQTSGASVAA